MSAALHVWILADVSRSVPGGMRRHMELHAEGLRRSGHRASTFFSEEIAETAHRAIPRRTPGVRAYSALHERYLAERPDIINVHTQLAPAWIVARRLGRLAARVVVMSYSADETAIRVRRPWDVLRWARAAVPARLSFPHADGIWCVNQQDRKYYVSEYSVPGERVRVYPHAVGDEFLDSPERPPRDPRQILFVGTWIVRKGVDVLAAALERVVLTLPDVRIVLAGTLVGEAVVRSALSPRLQARVRILDRANDAELRNLYRTSALLLVPSRREGLPIGMLEALACGCPPLAAANSGMLDVIVPGENGWLETSFDPERWANRLEALLGAPDELARASAGASESAGRFRIEVVTSAVSAWYQSLLEAP
ncbi:MAG TPA: glycosyltransferase family 4 protein [Polyangiaceae bacterium]|nr:glycosyltransferase family 4 protein [Polyangiaceae bacterium]